MISRTTCVMDFIIPNKPWIQFLKHPYGYLQMVVAFLKFLEQCNFCPFYNVLSMFHILTFIYVMSYDMVSIQNSRGMTLRKLYHKCSDSCCKLILVGLPGDKSPKRRSIIFIHLSHEFVILVQGFFSKHGAILTLLPTFVVSMYLVQQ